jgi:hypothetical protein
MIRIHHFGVVAILLACAATGPAADAGQKSHHHPHLHHALFELREARHELKAIKPDFGGHRDRALAAVHDAIQQIDHALKASGDTIKGTPTKRDLHEVYQQYKHHPHLHHALHELRHAHTELKEARHDFGGHRAAALRDVNHAIHQIELLLKHHKQA